MRTAWCSSAHWRLTVRYSNMELLKKFDIFSHRKIRLEEVFEATISGGWISIVGIAFMSLLFLLEFNAYMSIGVISKVEMDLSDDMTIKLNFNLSMPTTSCQFATVDVVDALGTQTLNITRNVQKWKIDFERGRKLQQVADGRPAPKYAQGS